MDVKSPDSSPLKIIAKVFNLKKGNSHQVFSEFDISLLTEINDKKVILEFNWIKDLNLIVSSFILDDFDENLLYQKINAINNILVIGTLKQDKSKSVIYKHTLPIANVHKASYMKKYLEDLLSEFNHLITVLLKQPNNRSYSSYLKNKKIVGHA